MTPNDIEVLIHCHCCPCQHPRHDAPAIQEALTSLQRNGLVYIDMDNVYRTTDRGRAHIEQLCSFMALLHHV